MCYDGCGYVRRARGCRSDVSRHDCRVACSWAEFRRRWVHISLTRRREYGDAAYSLNLYRRAGPPLVSVTFAQRKMKPAPCRPPWAWLCVLLHSTEHQEIKEMRVLRSAAGAKKLEKSPLYRYHVHGRNPTALVHLSRLLSALVQLGSCVALSALSALTWREVEGQSRSPRTPEPHGRRTGEPSPGACWVYWGPKSKLSVCLQYFFHTRDEPM